MHIACIVLYTRCNKVLNLHFQDATHMTQNNVQGGPAVPGCQSVALLSANIQRETTPVHLPSFVPSFGHECFTTLVVSCIYMYIYIYTQTNTQCKYTCCIIFFTQDDKYKQAWENINAHTCYSLWPLSLLLHENVQALSCRRWRKFQWQLAMVEFPCPMFRRSICT